MVLQDWMQYLQGLPADVGSIPLLLCATKPDLPGKQGVVHVPYLLCPVSALCQLFAAVALCNVLIRCVVP